MKETRTCKTIVTIIRPWLNVICLAVLKSCSPVHISLWLDNKDMPYICYEYVVVNIVKTEAREKLQGLQLPALQNQ